MSKFIIRGPAKISGEIEVMGAKNAALKMIAAALLTDKIIVLENVPRILDIETLLKIIASIGGKYRWTGEHSLEIDPKNINDFALPDSLVQKLRASVVLIGPLLARLGNAKSCHPGGCFIGARSIDTHLEAFKDLGVEIIPQPHRQYLLEFKKLKQNTVKLKEASVTATENILMFAAGVAETIEIQNAAREPEIENLASMLNNMGAKISGAGTNTITITVSKTLRGGKFQVIGDRIEAGTLLIAGAVSRGKLTVNNIKPEHLDNFLKKLSETGVKITASSNSITVYPADQLKATDISTAVYPGFPTDLQAPFGLLLTQCRGSSKITENLFSERFGYLEELTQMGARIKILNKHNAEISGPTPLKGTKIESLDLRAGATLLLAGTIAHGKTELSPAEIIDRGYEKIDKRLNTLGAKIQRIK